MSKWTGALSIDGDAPGIRFFPALLTVGSSTALVKVAGAAKTLYLASRFGVGDAYDAYLIAFLTPAFLADCSAYAIASSMIPVIAERDREGDNEGLRRLLSHLTLATIVVLALAGSVIAIFAGPLAALLGSSFTPEKIHITRDLLRMLLPLMVLGGAGSVWRAALLAHRRFALTALVPMATPLAIIIAVTLNNNVYSLAAGTVAGGAVEAAILGWHLRRYGLSWLPVWARIDPAIRATLRQYGPAFATALVMGACAVVTQAFAGALGSGSVAALNYGGRLLALVAAVGPAAISTVALPQFSEMAARKQFAPARSAFRSYSLLILLFTIPATAILIHFSEFVTRLLFERGRFLPEDTPLVAQIQSLYLLQLPVVMLTSVAGRVLASFQTNEMLLGGAITQLAAHMALSYWLMLRLGAGGLALASSLSAAVYLVYLLASVASHRKWKS